MATGCGTNDGTATANPSGGTTYTYTWSNGATSQAITGLQARHLFCYRFVEWLQRLCIATRLLLRMASRASANGTAATGCGTNDGAAGATTEWWFQLHLHLEQWGAHRKLLQGSKPAPTR
jgi:hypothetical protein